MDMLIVGLALLGAAYSWMNGEQAWKGLAEHLDLVHSSSLFGGKKLHGHLRGFFVKIEQVSDNNRGTKILIKIDDVNSAFTLGRDSAFQRMIKPDIETGDQLFDERTRIEGDADWALALLGPDARRLFEMLVAGWNGELKQGTLSASSKDLRDAPSTLDTLLDLAQLLRQPDLTELPKLLVERACHDPSSAVRFQAFRRLRSSNAFRKEALAVAEILLDAPSAHLRYEAGRLLLKSSSQQSDRAAQALTELITLRTADSSIRRSALETLVASGYEASAIPVMCRILESDDAPLVRVAAIEGLVTCEVITELLKIPVDDEAEAVTLARGLVRFDSAAQPKLLEILSRSGDRARLEAVRALDQIGDIQAIGALRKVAGQDRLFKTGLAREAEQAIESIKSRSDGSQQGEISIVTVAPLEGAVSPAGESEAGGEVSLTS